MNEFKKKIIWCVKIVEQEDTILKNVHNQQ